MTEEDEILASPRRRVKQSISVPFLWEEKPGTPKREWPMNRPTPGIIAPSPCWQWEEEPGKPHPAADCLIQKDETSSKDGSEYYDDWYSSISETDGNGSSTASADDAPVMEFFCPLPLPPNAGFLEKVLQESDAEKSSIKERRLAVKQTLTLGELILLSRKLSYRRKTVDKKRRFLMEFIKESIPACFSLKSPSPVSSDVK